MGKETAQALFTAGDNFAGLAQAMAQGVEGVEQHPLAQTGITPEQLMAVANTLHHFGHVSVQFPEPDTLGALSDRVNAKSGEYPLNIVVDEKDMDESPEVPQYLLSDMKRMGELAQLPILLTSQGQKDEFLSHPLVKQGLPSFVFVNVASNSQTFEENAAFADITRGLVEDEPTVFGDKQMREAFQGTPFGTAPPPTDATDKTEGPEN